MSKYSASQIANYFLERAEKDKKEMSLMKLVKLVYIAHGWSLAVYNQPLLSEEENVEAWRYGPVIPSLYHEFKHFGASSIDNGARSVIYQPDDTNDPIKPGIDKEDDDMRILLDLVWELYGDRTATSLMRLTHQKNTPWSKSYQSGIRNTQIEDDDIKKHFNELIEELIQKNV